MPELPEVEAVCSKLRPAILGRRIIAAKLFRCATPSVETEAVGRRIERVDRKGKHILLRLSEGVTVHTHLRMSGNLFAIPDHRLHSAGARVVLGLSGGAGLILEDPRALARMDARPTTEIDAELAELGPEPLSIEFTLDWLAGEAKRSRQPAKLFLMDQTRIAGLGNIYAAESLFRARVDPRQPICKLTRRKLAALHGAIVAVLCDAVKSAVVAYSGPGELREAETFPLSVYDREGQACLTCRRKIQRIVQGGRSTYFCPGCQK